MTKNNFNILGKSKMISLMKSQFEYTADPDVAESYFKYTKYGDTSERLEYHDDYYDDHHDLYHSIIAGKEECLYHVNDGRNKSIELPEPKTSVVDKLNGFGQKIKESENKTQNPIGNNLEHQRTQHER